MSPSPWYRCFQISAHFQIFPEKKNYFVKWRNGRLAGGRSRSHLFCCHRTEKGKTKLAKKDQNCFFGKPYWETIWKPIHRIKTLKGKLNLLKIWENVQKNGNPPMDEMLAQFKKSHQENCVYSGYFQRKDLKQCELVVSKKEGGDFPQRNRLSCNL